MPQPLSRVKPNAGWNLAHPHHNTLLHNPKLAALAMQVIASWANVDSFQLGFYMVLMGGSADRAAKVYLALETQSAKTSAVNAIARDILPPQHQEILAALLAASKAAQKKRDKIAHHVWGYSDELPDVLLLCDPRHLATANLWPGFPGGPNTPLSENVFVYREADFEAIIKECNDLCRVSMKMRLLLLDVPGKQALVDELLSEPAIRERLNPQA